MVRPPASKCWDLQFGCNNLREILLIHDPKSPLLATENRSLSVVSQGLLRVGKIFRRKKKAICENRLEKIS